jgi:hypothetical protein
VIAEQLYAAGRVSRSNLHGAASLSNRAVSCATTLEPGVAPPPAWL